MSALSPNNAFSGASTGEVKTAIILADSTGHTVENVVKAARWQYDGRMDIEIFPEIHTLARLAVVLAGLKARGAPTLGPIFTSFVVPQAEEMEAMVERFTAENELPYVPVIGPAVAALGRVLAEKRKGVPGFMNAVQFTLAHDDGQGEADSLEEAKIIFIGVSRTGKTSLCSYIATHYGLRVANYPYIAGIEIPPKYFEAERKGAQIIVLKRKPENLVDVRTARAEIDRMGESVQNYLDIENIILEQNALTKIAHQHNWKIIDVTRRLPEETAKVAVAYLNNKREQAGQQPYLYSIP